MCNLYTYKLSRDEVRDLLEHYKLVGQQWAELFEKEMAGKNDEALVYPKYRAPVVVLRDGRQQLEHMGWGMPSARARQEAEAAELHHQRAQPETRHVETVAGRVHGDCRKGQAQGRPMHRPG
jgi:putative SOS response-associated peptidase YedK